MKHAGLPFVGAALIVCALGCHDQPSARAEAPISPDPEGCRSFAARGAVELRDGRGLLSCLFDVENAEHRCEIAGAERVSSVTEYESLADFVEAGHVLGKQTSLTETRIENGRTHRLRHHYDELGRLVTSHEQSPGTYTTVSYFDYDELGRPRRATATTTGGLDDACGVRVMTIEYLEASRAVSRRSRPRHPERCGFDEQTVVERYDAAGNRVRVDAADGSGITSAFVASRGASMDRVCL